VASVGVDIGGSSVKAVRRSGDLVIERARVAHDSADRGSVTEALREAARSVGARGDDPIGVCLPGLVDPSSGALVRCANLPGLVGVRPVDLVEEATGRPPSVVTTDAAAWGLGVWETERIEGRLLVLAMGTGIGGAFLVDGEPLTLDGVTPGHLGMLDVSLGEADPPCAGDGTPGVLEAYCGGRALLDRFGVGRDAGALASEIASMGEDDPAIRALARGLRICHAVYKPDAVRLCGGLGAMYAPVLGAIDRLVRDRLTSVARDGWTLACVDGPTLAALGVALLTERSQPAI
jgi:glucokinase